MSAVHQRPKLTASQQAGHALIRKRHEEKLQVLRSQVEADPGCGLINHLGRVENRLHAGHLAAAGDAMIEIERALAQRADQVATDAAISQALKLATARSEVIDDQTSGNASVRILSRDGLLWLKAKKRLSTAETMALEKYRSLFDAAHQGPTGSNWGSVGGQAQLDRPEMKVGAIALLAKAREAVSHDPGLVHLLDEVAGRGVTLRDLAGGNRQESDRLEAELRVAARLLAKSFGYRS